MVLKGCRARQHYKETLYSPLRGGPNWETGGNDGGSMTLKKGGGMRVGRKKKKKKKKKATRTEDKRT